MQHNASFYVECVAWLGGYLICDGFSSKQNQFASFPYLHFNAYVNTGNLQRRRKIHSGFSLAVILMLLLTIQLDLQVSFPSSVLQCDQLEIYEYWTNFTTGLIPFKATGSQNEPVCFGNVSMHKLHSIYA